MDNLLSRFSLYDLLAFILPGGLFAAGTYWAVEGLPREPGATTTIGLIGLFFVVGELVQAVSVVWEGRYWTLTGGWPSAQLLNPGGGADAALLELFDRRLMGSQGERARQLPSATKFALARAELRARKLDERSELMNVRYALDRGLASVAVALVVVFSIAAILTDRTRPDAIAATIAGVAAVLLLNRFRRFGFWFARQVVQDYAALELLGP